MKLIAVMEMPRHHGAGRDLVEVRDDLTVRNVRQVRLDQRCDLIAGEARGRLSPRFKPRSRHPSRDHSDRGATDDTQEASDAQEASVVLAHGSLLAELRRHIQRFRIV